VRWEIDCSPELVEEAVVVVLSRNESRVLLGPNYDGTRHGKLEYRGQLRPNSRR
jgi:hypothetical protein